MNVQRRTSLKVQSLSSSLGEASDHTHMFLVGSWTTSKNVLFLRRKFWSADKSVTTSLPEGTELLCPKEADACWFWIQNAVLRWHKCFVALVNHFSCISHLVNSFQNRKIALYFVIQGCGDFGFQTNQLDPVGNALKHEQAQLMFGEPSKYIYPVAPFLWSVQPNQGGLWWRSFGSNYQFKIVQHVFEQMHARVHWTQIWLANLMASAKQTEELQFKRIQRRSQVNTGLAEHNNMLFSSTGKLDWKGKMKNHQRCLSCREAPLRLTTSH